MRDVARRREEEEEEGEEGSCTDDVLDSHDAPAPALKKQRAGESSEADVNMTLSVRTFCALFKAPTASPLSNARKAPAREDRFKGATRGPAKVYPTDPKKIEAYKRLAAQYAADPVFIAGGFVILIQPSSASVERVFSIVNRIYSKDRYSTLNDMIELSVMLAYNK